jgi:UDP-N-acetylglucosamine 2-epimerase
VSAEQPGNPRDYVAAMLRRDLGVEPTPEELDRLTGSLLAAGAFAPDREARRSKR